MTLTPLHTLYKFRQNLLTESEELRRLNPIMVYGGENPAAVKELGREFTRAAHFSGRRPWRLWYSLDIANYKVADSCRAFFEYEFSGETDGRRLHAHAVSSAYGLLGYQYGLDILAGVGLPVSQPGFLLVQHSATSDMVLHYLREGLGTKPNIEYELDPNTGLLRQDASPYFPYTTWSTEEDLEPTFYTKEPPTSSEMTRLMATHGGSGIVVSLHECLSRYSMAKQYLKASDCSLPADPRTLAEWSLVMAFVGVLNAVDRKLIDQFDEIVVHGSGIYLRPGDNAVGLHQATAVDSPDEIVQAVIGKSGI